MRRKFWVLSQKPLISLVFQYWFISIHNTKIVPFRFEKQLKAAKSYHRDMPIGHLKSLIACVFHSFWTWISGNKKWLLIYGRMNVMPWRLLYLSCCKLDLSEMRWDVNEAEVWTLQSVTMALFHAAWNSTTCIYICFEGDIFVHCILRRSRSASLVLAYLMIFCYFPLSNAIQRVPQWQAILSSCRIYVLNLDTVYTYVSSKILRHKKKKWKKQEGTSDRQSEYEIKMKGTWPKALTSNLTFLSV